MRVARRGPRNATSREVAPTRNLFVALDTVQLGLESIRSVASVQLAAIGGVALLDQHSTVEKEDLIRVSNARTPVGNEDKSPV